MRAWADDAPVQIVLVCIFATYHSLHTVLDSVKLLCDASTILLSIHADGSSVLCAAHVFSFPPPPLLVVRISNTVQTKPQS